MARSLLPLISITVKSRVVICHVSFTPMMIALLSPFELETPFSDQLCLAKTLHAPESITWRHAYALHFSLSFPDVCAPSTSTRLGHLRLSLPRRTPPGEPRPSATTSGSALKATTPPTKFRRQAVLDRSAKGLVWLEEIVDPRHPGDGDRKSVV